MRPVSKILAATVIGAGVIAGISYIKGLTRAKASLEIIPKVSLYQLSWDGLTFRIDVQIKNPSKADCSIKFPFVKVLMKDTLLGSSQAVNKDIRIPPYGEAMIEKVLVEMPVGSILSVAYALIKSLNSKEEVKITVKTMTTIDMGWVQVPYENSTDVLIRK